MPAASPLNLAYIRFSTSWHTAQAKQQPVYLCLLLAVLDEVRLFLCKNKIQSTLVRRGGPTRVRNQNQFADITGQITGIGLTMRACIHTNEIHIRVIQVPCTREHMTKVMHSSSWMSNCTESVQKRVRHNGVWTNTRPQFSDNKHHNKYNRHVTLD